MRPLFVLPGIGADARETLSAYAQRLACEVRIDEPFDLGGSSFGGMVAPEMARHLSPLRALRFVTSAVPNPPRFALPFVARWFGATSDACIRLFGEMLAATPSAFIRWASRAVFSWPGVGERVHRNRRADTCPNLDNRNTEAYS